MGRLIAQDLFKAPSLAEQNTRINYDRMQLAN